MNIYRNLGVSVMATEEEVREQFITHPFRDSKRVSDPFAVILNPSTRAVYDSNMLTETFPYPLGVASADMESVAPESLSIESLNDNARNIRQLSSLAADSLRKRTSVWRALTLIVMGLSVVVWAGVTSIFGWSLLGITAFIINTLVGAFLVQSYNKNLYLYLAISYFLLNVTIGGLISPALVVAAPVWVSLGLFLKMHHNVQRTKVSGKFVRVDKVSQVIVNHEDEGEVVLMNFNPLFFNLTPVDGTRLISNHTVLGVGGKGLNIPIIRGQRHNYMLVTARTEKGGIGNARASARVFATLLEVYKTIDMSGAANRPLRILFIMNPPTEISDKRIEQLADIVDGSETTLGKKISSLLEHELLDLAYKIYDEPSRVITPRDISAHQMLRSLKRDLETLVAFEKRNRRALGTETALSVAVNNYNFSQNVIFTESPQTALKLIIG